MNKTSGILDSLYLRHPELKEAEIKISKAYEILLKGCLNEGKILVCGNGGSASDSEHIVGELMKGFRLKRNLSDDEKKRFLLLKEEGVILAEKLQQGIPAISLNSQTSVITAIGNDTSYDMIFAQQLYVCGHSGDVLIAMSTSGNSKNVVNAAMTAKVLGIPVIGITGRVPGKLGDICDLCLMLPADETYLVQELTLPVYHALCAMLEVQLFG